MCVKLDIPNNIQVFEICQKGLHFYARILKGRSINQETPECLTSLGLLRRTSDGDVVAIDRKSVV